MLGAMAVARSSRKIDDSRSKRKLTDWSSKPLITWEVIEWFSSWHPRWRVHNGPDFQEIGGGIVLRQ